ncbi:MAG: 3-oxoacyl-ACP reductase FabG [Planctomycetes bacterium]|nr:3-oxoacyl-ACP reductase FabG [Planctomycetota bacterium]MCB9869793.1 3-oxoacyl-ACP reductase FabG [Planctomycetota bacterium]
MSETPRDWILVTGGSRGIGRAIVEAIATPQRHLVLTYLRGREAAEQLVDTLRAADCSAEALGFDVGDSSECAQATEQLRTRLGAPYGIVNNAGVHRDGLMVWMKPDDWRDVLRTNLDSFFYVTQPFLKGMLANRRGRIINITSTAGQVGNAGQVNYAASKAGLIGATRALAKEVAPRGITVNAVAPGFVDTDMTADLPADRLKSMIPAGRFGQAREVAAVVSFLLTEGAGYVTGQVIGVNGGLA